MTKAILLIAIIVQCVIIAMQQSTIQTQRRLIQAGINEAKTAQTIAADAIRVSQNAIAQRDYAYEHSSYEPKH